MATTPPPMSTISTVKVTSVIKWLENINLDDKHGEIMGLGITNGARITVERIWTPNSQPELAEFTVFSNLPAELRIKIWRLAIPGARIVTIVSGPCRGGNKCDDLDSCVDHLPMAKSRNTNEFAVSAVNRESRQELLQTHRFSFRGDLQYPIFFDFKIDTLFFANERALQQFDDVIRTVGCGDRVDRLYDNLRHVMIVMHGAHLGSDTDRILGQMLKLESVKVIPSDLCKRNITSMGLENERGLHEIFLQSHWIRNGADVFPVVTLNSVNEDESGEPIVGEPYDGCWGGTPRRGYRASRRIIFQSQE